MNIKSVVDSIKRAYRQVRGLFNSKLPNGFDEFNVWIDNIINTYKLPTKHRDSVVFTMSTMIMHLGPQADKKPIYYFVKAMRASAAKQIAHEHMVAIKEKQKQEQESLAAASANSGSNVSEIK